MKIFKLVLALLMCDLSLGRIRNSGLTQTKPSRQLAAQNSATVDRLLSNLQSKKSRSLRNAPPYAGVAFGGVTGGIGAAHVLKTFFEERKEKRMLELRLESQTREINADLQKREFNLMKLNENITTAKNNYREYLEELMAHLRIFSTNIKKKMKLDSRA